MNIPAWPAPLLVVLLVGCANEGYVVTGGDATTSGYAQSETSLTAASAGGQTIDVVAYNDLTDTSTTIAFTPTTRVVSRGASLMGWSYSLDAGQTWTHGGKVAPPAGWAVLWGDPAITTSQAKLNVVFMSNLAVPDSKMPAGGSISGALNNFLGGACVAKSTDGGKTFGVYQTLSNQNHFYDGASMASSVKGEVYAAYVDTNTDQIDVWRAADENGQFQMLPSPFPNRQMWSHPRIRANLNDGSLYVAAQTSDWTVLMARWNGSAWSTPLRVTQPCELYPQVHFPSGKMVRTGPQFSFDIRETVPGQDDAIRILYTRKDAASGRLFVTGAYARADLSHAWEAPEWGTQPGNFNTPGDQFNPNVCAWGGLIDLPPVWMSAFVNRQNDYGDAVDLWKSPLDYTSSGVRYYFPLHAIKGTIAVCPDQRGYWGDYDALIVSGFGSDPNDWRSPPGYLRTISDSSQGCTSSWMFSSQALHIRTASFK